jgi:hypothetical protein
MMKGMRRLSHPQDTRAPITLALLGQLLHALPHICFNTMKHYSSKQCSRFVFSRSCVLVRLFSTEQQICTMVSH